MAKKKRDSDSNDPAGKKIGRAQERLGEAQHLYEEAVARGRRAVEKAQARAAEWLQEASELVQRRTDALERAQSRAGKASATASLEIVESPALQTVDAPEIAATAVIVLAGREAAALQALRGLPGDGVTAQEWRAAAGMSGTTFARSREALVRYGLVNLDGEPSRTTRYTVTDTGAQFDLEAVTEQ